MLRLRFNINRYHQQINVNTAGQLKDAVGEETGAILHYVFWMNALKNHTSVSAGASISLLR